MDSRAPLILAGLLVLTAALYSPLRTAPFVFEDAHYLAAAPAWHVPGRGLTVWAWQAIGPHAGRQHVANLALHLVNGTLVYALAGSLAPSAGLIAAGLFLLHPLSSEAVAYVTGRAELLLTGWTLLAVWLALQWNDRGGWARLAGAALAIGLAALSKEVGLVAGPLVVLTLALCRPARPQIAAVLHGLYFGAGVVLGATWWRLSSWFALTVSGGGTSLPWRSFAAVQLAGLWRLVALLVWPVGFTVDHDPVALSAGWQRHAVLLTLAVAVLLAWCWRRAPLVAWALGWLAITVAPRFVFATNEFIAERHLYLAMPAVSVLVGAALPCRRGACV